VKGLFIFGRPRQRRLAMTFGYECRPSFWRTIRANSHLVIAGVGTASFLGVAGLALWLAMPSIERPAFADSRQETVVQQAAAAPLASQVAAAAPEPAAAPRSDEVTPQTAAAEAEIPVLKPNDLRWKDPNAPEKPAPAPAPSVQALNAEAKAATPADGEPAADAANSPLSAFAAANRAQVGGDNGNTAADSSQTAAIPTAKPQPPAEKSAPAAKDEPTQEGRILHGVTMRASPKKGAAALTTIPAKTIVQVVSCKQWCEVVYKGRHGFIYKSFVKHDD
jgi:hypothetical protein